MNKNNKLNIINLSFNGMKKLINGEMINVNKRPIMLTSKKL